MFNIGKDHLYVISSKNMFFSDNHEKIVDNTCTCDKKSNRLYFHEYRQDPFMNHGGMKYSSISISSLYGVKSDELAYLCTRLKGDAITPFVTLPVTLFMGEDYISVVFRDKFDNWVSDKCFMFEEGCDNSDAWKEMYNVIREYLDGL